MCAHGAGRGCCVYLLYLATCLCSPPLILAGKAGLPEKRGGFAHLDPKLIESGVKTKGTQTGVSSSMPTVGGARIGHSLLGLLCSG